MLFKENTKVLLYASFTGTPNFSALVPTIRMIESDHLVKLLGFELYNGLNSAYQLITNEDSLSAANKLLLDQCRMVIGPYLCYYYSDKAAVELSTSSTNRAETDKSKTAFQYQVNNFKEAHLREAEKASELLLQFLEENKTNYPDWVTSKAFARYKKLFIQTAADFDDNYKTASPYRNYWAMRWKMFDVEELEIRPQLGDEMFDDLKAKIANPDTEFSDKETQLINMLKKAIAYFTVAFALPHLSVRIDEDGISVVGLIRSSNDKDNRLDAPDNKFTSIANSATDSALKWMETAIAFIEKNKTDFTLFPITEEKPKCSDSGNSELTGAFGLL